MVLLGETLVKPLPTLAHLHSLLILNSGLTSKCLLPLLIPFSIAELKVLKAKK